MRSVGILGGGAWGTALAGLARANGRHVTLWAREPEVVAAINQSHENASFLPGVALDTGLRATSDIAEACAADCVVIAVPAAFVRAVTTAAEPLWRKEIPGVICAKGIERGSGERMTEVLAETLPTARVAVLSGPSFATEVARGLPTAVTFASRHDDLRAEVPPALATPHFRIYTTDDVTGVEFGGAAKNVLAIACGIIEGRGLGDNARAALITRGLAEMTRLATAAGARLETLAGLSGLGDLVLTCSALQSRNYSLGVALGRGAALADILADRRGVTEGVFTAEAVVALASARGVEMPICAAVDSVLNRDADIDATISDLLARPASDEAPRRS